MAAHRPRRRFSQNFLRDAAVIARVVDAIAPQPSARVIEIGPGQGALTAPLIARAGHITAIEIDRDLAEALRARFAAHQLTLTVADALTLDWPALAASDARPLTIAGNLPYHISTPLLFALLPIADRVAAQIFMLQKEVVDRMIALPGGRDYGRLSVMLQARYRLAREFDVPPHAFAPEPKVHSSIVRMLPRPAAELPALDQGDFARVVRTAFNQRRKTLRNALRLLLPEAALRASGVDPDARAETLDQSAFVRLAQQLTARASLL